MNNDTHDRLNEHQQPIGEDVPNWDGAKTPELIRLEGKHCRLEPLSKDVHMRDLFDAFSTDKTGEMWTYMPVGPFFAMAEFEDWMGGACASKDPLFTAILDKRTGKAVGFASLMRITPEHGVIEVGYIAFSPMLQRTPIATEAMFLLL